jgi:hypothetical protein
MSSDRSSNDLLETVRVSFIYRCKLSREAVQIVSFFYRSTFHIAFETNNIKGIISNIRQNYL